MARPTNTEARREQIVAAMGRIVARQGYAGASIQEIAAEAQLPAGLIHYYFTNKQQILTGLLDRLAAGLDARIDAFTRAAGDDEKRRLDALLRAMLSPEPDPSGAAVDPDAVACWVNLAVEVPRLDALRPRWTAIVAAWRGRLRDRVEARLGEERRALTASEEIATALLAAIQGCFLLATTLDVPAGFAARRVSEMAEGLIAAQPHVKGG